MGEAGFVERSGLVRVYSANKVVQSLIY